MKIHHMRFITFSGIDGSGKSTQAAYIKDILTKQGERVYTLHAVTFSIANILYKKKAIASHDPHKTATTEASFYGIVLRVCALIVDTIRFSFLVRRLERNGYTTIISDRSFFDMVINIRYLSGSTKIGFLERIIPHPAVAFFMEIAPERVMVRARAPEQGLTYLQAKDALFRHRVTLWRMHRINADQDPTSVTKDLCAILAACHSA